MTPGGRGRGPGRGLAVVLAALAAAGVGCAFEDQKQLQVAARGEQGNFATYVQPVLATSCASLDCHGMAGRPLRLYAKHGLRMDAALRGQEASEAELSANIASIAALDPDASSLEDNLLLLKPLAVKAGGMHHVGGDLWANQADPAYRCLHAWLRAGASDAIGQAVCKEAAP